MTTTLPSFEDLALSKLARVLGPEQGRRVFAETLVLAGLTELGTADDLHHFAECLATRKGIEAAVGGLLSVAAVLRGASTRS